MNSAYVRVSTAEQNEQREIEALKQYDIDKWFIDKCSGKDTDRHKFKEMIEFVREGDTIYVMDWSRLSRSTVDLLKIIDSMDKHNIQLVSLKENFDTNLSTGRLMLSLIAAINEFERQNLLERQREGIAIAKAQGKYTGRKPVKRDEQLVMELIYAIKAKQISVSEAARRLKVTRATVYSLIARYEAEYSKDKE